MSGLITVYDAESEEPDYSYRNFSQSIYNNFREYLIDYDQRDENSWSTYEITRQAYTLTSALKSILITWDDGTSTLKEPSYIYALGGFPIDFYQTYTQKDRLGNTESIVTFFENIVGRSGESSRISYSQLEYNVDTGKLDYSYEVYKTGLIEAKDFNKITSLIDYAYTEYGDGHTLAQDYDALGRLDYVVETLADGRMIVTDYDLLDQQQWASYSIAYSASGGIDSVIVV